MMGSPLTVPVQDVKYNQGKQRANWSANWLVWEYMVHGQNLLYNAQRKRGKEYMVVWETRSTFTPTMQDVTCNQGKQGAAWLEVRDGRYQLHKTFSGICSGPCYARTYSPCLLPWDPGEKTRISRVSLLNSDSALGACVVKMDTHLSGSRDHH